jgi:hypothetical protein
METGPPLLRDGMTKAAPGYQPGAALLVLLPPSRAVLSVCDQPMLDRYGGSEVWHFFPFTGWSRTTPLAPRNFRGSDDRVESVKWI